MYIFERLLGGFLYTSLLVITLIMLKITNKRKLKNVLAIYLIFLIILAYFFIPARGADLYRLIDLSNIYYFMPKNNFYELLVNSIEPLSLIYLRFIGFLKNPKLMPALTATIFYFLTFKIIIIENKKNLFAKNTNLVLLLFLMSSSMFFEVISGIRSMLSIIFISFSLYSFFVFGKRDIKTLFLLVIGIFFHKIGIAIFLIILLYVGLKKIKSSKNYLGKIIYLLLLLITILLIVSKEDNGIIRVYTTFQNYILYGKYSYIWEYLLGVTQLWILLKINSNVAMDNRYYELSSFMKFFNFLIILLFVEYNTFHRLVYFSTILSIPLILQFLENTKKNKIYLIILISVLNLLISLSRGNLSSYKFLSF